MRENYEPNEDGQDEELADGMATQKYRKEKQNSETHFYRNHFRSAR